MTKNELMDEELQIKLQHLISTKAGYDSFMEFLGLFLVWQVRLFVELKLQTLLQAITSVSLYERLLLLVDHFRVFLFVLLLRA